MTAVKATRHHIEPLAHLIPELKELLKEGQWDVLKEFLVDLSPIDLAESWYQFSSMDRIRLFKLMEPRQALVLFESLPVDERAHILKSIEDPNLATAVIEEATTHEITEVFHKLPQRTVRKMVALVKKKEAVEKINLLMKFAPKTAGAIMHPEFIRLGPRLKAKDALAILQNLSRAAKEEETLLHCLYVTDDDIQLIGSLSLEQLVSAPPDSILQDIMNSVEPIKLTADLDQEKVADIFTKYNLISAPVVDAGDRLIGVIAVEDIIDVINAEASEDIAKMAGTSASELEERSVFKIVTFRAPWLLATLATQIVVSFVMRHFNYVLSEIIALATFLPLVAAMGGNVGSQSAVIFVRGLALGRLKGKAKYAAVIREAMVGLSLGVIYGVLVAGVAYIIYGDQYGMHFVMVVGAAVNAAIIWAAVAGAVGPLIFEKLGIDPATAIGPMVTTLTDLFSITFYFLLAVVFLIHGPVF